MDLLVLGGTVFIGRHVVRAALDAGHRVTLFHRGRHALEPDARGVVVARVEELLGDRGGDLHALSGGRWDAVVDLSGYYPWHVSASARALSERVARYTFVSSVAAYAGFESERMTESAPLAGLSPTERREAEGLDRERPEHQERFWALYGGLKAACEAEVESALPGRSLVVRPGLVVGPHDHTDRFTYWVERVARGGDVLAPGRAAQPVQFVDARDLAAWIVRMTEAGATGAYHATGPAAALSLGELLETCREVSGSRARSVWIDEAALLEAGVVPWSELPLWIPESDSTMRGFQRLDCSKAIAAGLRFRPLEDTVRDTLRWSASRPVGSARRAGMAVEREQALLARAAGARPSGAVGGAAE